MKAAERDARIAAARRRDLLPSLISVLVHISNAWMFPGKVLRGDPQPQPEFDATPSERRFIRSQWEKINAWHLKSAALFGGTAVLQGKGANFFRDVEFKLNYMIEAVAQFAGDVSYTRHLKILTALYELLLYDYIHLRPDRRQPLLYLDQTLSTFCARLLPFTDPDNLAVNQAYYTARARMLEWPDFSPYESAPKTAAMQWAEDHPETPLGSAYLAFSEKLAVALKNLSPKGNAA